MTADKWTVKMEIDKKTGNVSYTSDVPGSGGELDESDFNGGFDAVMNATLAEYLANDLTKIFDGGEINIDVVAETSAFLFCQLVTRRIVAMAENGSTPMQDIGFLRDSFNKLAERMKANTEIGHEIIVDLRATKATRDMLSDPDKALKEILAMLSEIEGDSNTDQGNDDDNDDKPKQDDSSRLWRSSK